MGSVAMEKKRIRENPAALEPRAAARIEGGDCEGGGCAEQRAVSARKDGTDAPPAQETAQPRPRSHRELGEAILSGRDPVKVGRELLDKSDDRGAPTRLRALETYADWTFGKPGAEGHRKPPRIIWDIPGPPYEPPDPEREKVEGGDK